MPELTQDVLSAASVRCPCCGLPVEALVEPGVVVASTRLGPSQRRLADLLARNFGQWVSVDDCREALGGSYSALSPIVHVVSGHVRRALAPHGLALESGYGAKRLVWRAR